MTQTIYSVFRYGTTRIRQVYKTFPLYKKRKMKTALLLQYNLIFVKTVFDLNIFLVAKVFLKDKALS